MIPKIIHYCWLSGDKYPSLVEKCIQTWKDNLPGWDFRLWDKSCLEEITEPWVHEAYQAKVYSHASDYIRLYAVYKYGGFYLDTDVEVLKDFSPLLKYNYVFGMENAHANFIEAATFGAEAGNQLLLKCMEAYHGQHFIKPDGSYDYGFMIPKVLKESMQNITIISETIPDQFDNSSTHIFPTCYFSPKNCDTEKFDQLTDETYSIHHFRGSWFPMRMQINRFIWKHFSNRHSHLIQNAYWKVKRLITGK